MQLDTAYAPRCPCCGNPRRIAHLLDLYERNFQLLERLVPELELPFERAVSKSATDLPLHLIVVERAPYTSELRLTYEFVDPEGKRLEPDLWIRVYRDARVAEALHCGARAPWTASEEGDPEVAKFLNDQWTRNHTLAKWLEYLLEHGHGFTIAARPRNAVSGSQKAVGAKPEQRSPIAGPNGSEAA